MSAAQYNRSLTTIKTELEFLLDSEVITKSLFDHINSCLPDKYTKGMEPVDYVSNNEKSVKIDQPPAYQPPSAPPSASPSIAQIPQAPPTPVYIDFVEAIYDFQPQQPEDLQLYAGDKIKVTEKTSEAWWKGECNGRVGVFPSNYVRSISNNNVGESRNSPAPNFYQPPQNYYQQPMYAPPPPPPQQQQQLQVQPVQVMQQGSTGSGTGSALKNFGSRLGEAAIFGAGATIGSDIVNSIF